MFPSIRGSSPFLKPSFQNPTSVKPELPLMTREFDFVKLETIADNHQQNKKQKRRDQLMISGSSYGAQNQAAERIMPVNAHGGGVPKKERRSRNKNLRLRSRCVKVRRHLNSQGASVKLPHQTANKLFGLQEMLGFPDVNQTMDWLLTQSEAAIKSIPDTMLSFSNEADGTESASSCSG